MKKNIILGAGLSGLACHQNLDGSVVFEAGDQPGGHCRSHFHGGVHFDEGAHICHSQDADWLKFLHDNAGGESGVERIPASKVGNHWNRHWFTYPVQNHLAELPEDVRISALTGLVEAQISRAGTKPSNYEEWLRRQYGDFLTDTFYKIYTQKYWRVPMHELGTDWLGGRLLPSELHRIIAGAIAPQEESQSTFARFFYPRQGGFFRFFEKAFASANIETGHRASQLDPIKKEVQFENGRRENFDRMFSSIPLPALVAITKDVPDSILADAAQLRWTSMLCVNLIIKKRALTPYHWFYVYNPELDVCRVSVPSNLAPSSAPVGATVLQAELFRGNHESFGSIQALEKQTVNGLAVLLGFDPDRDLQGVYSFVVPQAYILSDHARARAVENIRAWFAERHVITMGMGGEWKFLWSDAAWKSGASSAEADG